MNSKGSKVVRTYIGIAAQCGQVGVMVLALGICMLLGAVAPAQDDPEIAPPPLKTMSKDERARLNSRSDLKDRTKLALEFMTGHMNTAEKLSDAQDYEGMFRELGSFQALMDDALEVLNTGGPATGKVLDNLKRLEIGLRGFSPRIETIRRELPIRYDDYVRKLMRYVREARVKATDPMFGETVLPARKPGN